MAFDRSAYDHPAWWTALGTGVGYLLILAVMTAALFLIPWLIFSAL